MGIKVVLNHRTEYRYDKSVSLGPQVVQLRPAPHCRTPILSYSFNVTPSEHFLRWQLDPHYNHSARLLFPGKTTEFVVDVSLITELSPVNPFDFFLEPGIEDYPFEYTPELTKDLEPYRTIEPAGPLLQAFLNHVSREKRGTIGFLVDLNRRVRDGVGYVTRLDPGVQTCDHTLEKRTGSCRDSAWLLVQILRHLGIAARFVSGYLIQLAPDEGSPERPNGLQDDSADLHAWTEAFLPGAGWIGMDPTSGLFAGEGHIPLVCTPNAYQAAPIGGTVEPSHVDFSYSMSIRRLDETPRPSKPVSEQDWLRIRQVAHKVDAELKEQDVRLTMGGEPTFVGIDDPESPQWNNDALGSMKRTRGLALIQCLREKIAPGAMLHYGQGKWYPGETLPRWALSCYWRADRVPVWENVDLIAPEDQDYGFGAPNALKFMEALTHRLQVSAANLLPVFNAEAESTEPSGYVLPIRRRQSAGQLFWSSQLWFPRPERLVLMAGDSPIGYRLPVDLMPWVAPDEVKYEFEAAPFADRVKLPLHTSRPDLFSKYPNTDPLPALSSTAEGATQLIRPALCVQAREGRLHVFLPYAANLADYLDLLAAVEDTCQYLNKPIWLEGYTPPSDPRLRSFSITPDPGVLEVNLPPASNWDELEQINTVLFEEARRNRLTAEKFTYNGSHTATGGGSHIVLGGANVLDSPFLRRSDLLRSLLAFWQNHPSLSYLFSGMYIGATSQYPRVDEARADALYELEIAFNQLTASDCRPSTLDGLFRNLLVDITGNTHRSEFCIDKLYPPEGLGLRLGLLELRAFEMAPHVRMGLLQMLVVRALVCRFWKHPYVGGLVRWRAALRDRFLLPHFVRRDFADVLSLLRQSGYDFEEKWFASHFEFRFPKIGSIVADGVELELRQALEPWNVLAEDSTSGRTVRVVDSSLDRVQVKLSGFATDSRYIVTCNGRRVPLYPTGNPGESVAAVRYCARRLSAVFHPTVPVHAPLALDIIDLWNHRSIGRCTYHFGAPDGGVYSSRPGSVTEAEARRMERFQKSEDTIDLTAVPKAETNPIYPMTLDLRQPAPSQRVDFRKPGLVL
jgi:uncharacterized protein (DUF2126 family)